MHTRTHTHIYTYVHTYIHTYLIYIYLDGRGVKDIEAPVGVGVVDEFVQIFVPHGGVFVVEVAGVGGGMMWLG
jgi:hypothetical protein